MSAENNLFIQGVAQSRVDGAARAGVFVLRAPDVLCGFYAGGAWRGSRRRGRASLSRRRGLGPAPGSTGNVRLRGLVSRLAARRRRIVAIQRRAHRETARTTPEPRMYFTDTIYPFASRPSGSSTRAVCVSPACGTRSQSTLGVIDGVKCAEVKASSAAEAADSCTASLSMGW